MNIDPLEQIEKCHELSANDGVKNMETNTEYKVEPNPEVKTSPNVAKRRLILTHPYTQTVKEFMLAMIASGYSYEDNDHLYTIAKEATDTLIKKVGEKL